jgi:Tol biopolymer transport system component
MRRSGRVLGAHHATARSPRLRLAVVGALGSLMLSSCTWMTLVSQEDGLDFHLGYVTVSADGLHLAYQDSLAGEPTEASIGIRDLRTGGDSFLHHASQPSLDHDARLVGYTKWPGLTHTQVYVYNQANGTNVLVSANVRGGIGNSWSSEAAMSWDGTHTGFASSSTDLVSAGGSGQYDIYVRQNLAPKSTVRASVDTTGAEPDGPSAWPALSSTGRYVAFESTATDLVAGDQNGLSDVFVRDLDANTTTRVSVSATGGDPDGESHRPSISADGRYVAFSSNASNLVTGDANGADDIFVRDLLTGTTRRASISSAGAEANGGSLSASISGSGGYVAFYSGATNLVTGDTNGVADVFVRDLTHDTTTRVSLDPNEQQGNGDSSGPSLSYSGSIVGFFSKATNLAPGDPSSKEFVLARAVAAPAVTSVIPATSPSGSTATITIRGTGFTPTSSVITDGSHGVTVNSVSYVSATELHASVTIGPAAAPGPRSIIVATPGPGPGLVPASYGACTCFTVT